MLDLNNLLKFKRKSCVFNNVIEEDIPYNYINLYVKITDTCNINCSFCEYHNTVDKFIFDFKKLETILKSLEKENIYIKKNIFYWRRANYNI